MFSADRSTLVRDVMQTAVLVVQEGTDQEEIANLFAAHHLLAIPIVDTEGRMKRVVAVDDIVDVVEEEASEDIQKIGGMEALDEPYLPTRSHRMIRKRGSWLLLSFSAN